MNTESYNIPRLSVNFIIFSGGEAISKLLMFVSFAYLARVLGPEGFGIIELALAITLIFSQIVTFGTTKYGSVEVAKDKSQVQT